MNISTDWATQLRKAIKSQVGRGWLVMPDYGRMRLQVRRPGIKTQSMNLPFAWEEAAWVDALQHIKVIAKAFNEGGVDLKGAAKVATVVRSDHDTDWTAAAAAYRQHKQRVSDRTWRQKYTPVFEAALKALGSKNAPTNGADLCDAALKRWAPGTRQRQIMRQSLSGFLRFCVQRRSFKSCWLPPAAVDGEYVNEKRIGYPLTDAQVLRLVDAVPDTAAGHRWRFALQLLAVYGLRPEDLRISSPATTASSCGPPIKNPRVGVKVLARLNVASIPSSCMTWMGQWIGTCNSASTSKRNCRRSGSQAKQARRLAPSSSVSPLGSPSLLKLLLKGKNSCRTHFVIATAPLVTPVVCSPSRWLMRWGTALRCIWATTPAS